MDLGCGRYATGPHDRPVHEHSLCKVVAQAMIRIFRSLSALVGTLPFVLSFTGLSHWRSPVSLSKQGHLKKHVRSTCSTRRWCSGDGGPKHGYQMIEELPTDLAEVDVRT